MRKKLPTLSRNYSSEEISKAILTNRLLTLSIKLPTKCNLKCRYCYGNIASGDLSYGEILDILRQASQLGARSLSIVGEGEPLMYKDKTTGKNIFNIIAAADKLKMNTVIFTNNTLIDQKTAQQLYALNVSIVCKLNSLNSKVQDYLSGVTGSLDKIKRGLDNLEKAGFSKSKNSRLAIHTIICRQNYKEVPFLWKMWRKKNIIPYVQPMVPPASGHKNHGYYDELKILNEDIKDIFHLLSKIDKEEFGFNWDPDYTYPIAGMGCSVVKTGCCVNSQGQVQLCGYLDEMLGDIRMNSLADIIKSEKVSKIRRHNYYKPNKVNPHFYGCRSTTFNKLHDRFCQDPLFWRNSNY